MNTHQLQRRVEQLEGETPTTAADANGLLTIEQSLRLLWRSDPAKYMEIEAEFPNARALRAKLEREDAASITEAAGSE